MKGLCKERDRGNYQAVTDSNKEANYREYKDLLRKLALFDLN